jgi:uracil-DNA glycosylase family 4
MALLFPENNYIPPKMGPSLRLVVAEAPGEVEDVKGEPLVGGAGKIFDSMCRRAGVNRDDITLVNIVNCRPPDNKFPTDPAARVYCTAQEGEQIVAHCVEHHVMPLLASRPWSLINALGDKALKALTGKREGIFKWRGSPLPLIGEKVNKVVPTLHPAYIMRDQSMAPAVISDLQKGTQVPPQFYTTRPTLEEMESFHADQLVFDIETNRFTQAITMVGINDLSKPFHVIVAPFQGVYIRELKRIFSEAKEVIGQNIIGFDLEVLAEAGIVIGKDVQIWDIMLMHHLLQPDSPHDLEYIATIFTQMVAWKHLNAVDMAWYNACDTDATGQIFSAIKPLLQHYRLLDLYNLCQVPIGKICRQMSDAGVKVDKNRIKVTREKFEAELKELEQKLPEPLRPYDKSIRVRQLAPAGTVGKAGKPVKYTHIPGTERVVPWDSPQRVAKYLYETLKLPKQLHAKTKQVTADKTALDRLYRKTQLPELLVLRQVRELGTLISTFLQDPTDDKEIAVDRLHSNFLVHGTNTGRLSSSSPDMQNIPFRARYIYVPSFPDWCLVEADFSGLENCLAAWYANDTDRLKRLAVPGFSEHRWLASQIFGIPEAQIDKKSDEYNRAKHTNHGADAGMGPRKMSIQYNIPEKDCKQLLTMWKTLNHVSADWQERTGNQAIHDGILTTAFGRKRWFWSTTAYTEAIRFMLQSTGADVCFRAMIGLCYDAIHWPIELALKVCPVVAPIPFPARLILQVHDSLLIECPYNLREDVVDCLRKVMEQPWTELAGYSFHVDVKAGEPGESWGELKLVTS